MKKLLLAIVILMASVAINAQTTLPAFWTFTNPSPTQDSTMAPNGWKTRLDIVISGSTPYTYATGSDGTPACRLDGTGEYVQVWFADNPGQLSYYIKGTGISPNPPFSGSFVIQESVNGTTWNTLSTHTSMTLSFVKFTQTITPTSRYVRFYYLDKQSGSNVALDSVYLKPAPQGAIASINIKKAGVSIVNNSQVIIGNTSNTPFTIENKGVSQLLRINSFSITGANATDFSVPNMPDSIAGDSSKIFNLMFSPSSSGSRFATLNINNNDTAKSPYIINLYGIGGSYATEPTLQANTLTFSNIKPFAFWVNFNDPTSKPEKYIVLRKIGSPITETPTDGASYMRGDFIGNAQVAYIGSGTSFKPPHIIANSNYYFKVFSFNGPAGYENYLTTNPLSGTATSSAKNYGNYYAGINAVSPSFIAQLSAKINPHDTIYYSNYTATIVNDFFTRDTSNGMKVVTCVYTGLAAPYNEPFIWWGNGPGGTLSREHTYSQSWMPSNTGGNWPLGSNGKELPEYSDQHNLFPTDQLVANVKRSNYPFGEIVGAPTYVSPTGEGKLGKDSLGNTVYEPRNEQKGDAARALFYMCVTYNGVAGRSWKLPASQNQAVLKKWHKQDLPTPTEIAQNEYVASIQNNRNPFIDSVEFADRIDFSTMTYIQDTIANPIVTLNIISPKVNDVFLNGKAYYIKWQSNNADTIEISFSSNDGANYTVLANRPSSGVDSLLWNPTTLTTNGRIRIRHIKSGTNNVSGKFIVDESSISILNPQTNDLLITGRSYFVKWNSKFVDSLEVAVSINNGANYTVINKLAGNKTDSVNWIPDAATTQAVIRVRDLFDGNLSASVNFKIESPEITFIKPDSNDVLQKLTPTFIVWQSKNIDSIEISVSYEGKAFLPITSIATNQLDSFNWTPQDEGNYVVLKIKDLNSETTALSKQFSVGFLGVKDLNSFNEFKVFPNPFGNKLDLTFTSEISANADVKITDITGRILFSKSIKLLQGTNQLLIDDLEFLQQGTYLVSVKSETQSARRIIIKN